MELAAIATDDLRRFVHALTSPVGGGMRPATDDHDRIERVRLFEELKSAAAAAQADEAVAFDRSQRAAQAVAHAATGAPATRTGRGIASQLALARRISPWAAQRWLGFAKVATAELPVTFAELRAGRTSEWRAMIVARETAMLAREDRAAADVQLAPRLQEWGDRQVDVETRRCAYRLDPHGVVARARRAASERRVSIRPVPDAMCRVSALLPLAQGVSVYAALSRAADLHVGSGAESRTRSQVMADLVVERVMRPSANETRPVAPTLEIQLVMTDQALLDAGAARNEPALLTAPGIGSMPVPAGIARDLALNTDGRAGHVGARWIRRLYTKPGTGRLVAMESTRRLFTRAQRRFLTTRDQVCRTNWCDAPVRHADHVRPAARGGATTIANGAGRCETCNHAKEALAWRSWLDGDVIVTVTPTGHRYRSRAPDLPRASRVELYVAARLRATAA